MYHNFIFLNYNNSKRISIYSNKQIKKNIRDKSEFSSDNRVLVVSTV